MAWRRVSINVGSPPTTLVPESSALRNNSLAVCVLVIGEWFIFWDVVFVLEALNNVWVIYIPNLKKGSFEAPSSNELRTFFLNYPYFT